MKYLKGKVKDADGSTVKIIKTFDEAVLLATQLNNTWNDRCAESDCPSHWNADFKPCSGITKTTRGYDLRAGADLLTTDTKHTNYGIASWIFGLYAPPTATSNAHDNPQPTYNPSPITIPMTMPLTMPLTMPMPLTSLSITRLKTSLRQRRRWSKKKQSPPKPVSS